MSNKETVHSARAWALSLSKMHRGQGVVVYKSPPPIALSPLFLSIFSLFFIFQCPFPAKAGDKNSCLDFVELTAGYEHTCTRTSGGAVYCWGDNTFGQLGKGSTSGEYGTPQVVFSGGSCAGKPIPKSAGVFSTKLNVLKTVYAQNVVVKTRNCTEKF